MTTAPLRPENLAAVLRRLLLKQLARRKEKGDGKRRQ